MIRKLTKRHWTFIFIFILLILFFYFILPVSIPLITAFITAIILSPLVRLIQRRTKLNRKVSVIIVFLLFSIMIGFTGSVIVTKAIAQVVNFVEDVPTHVNELNIIYTKWENDFQQYTQSMPPDFFREVSNSLEENINDLAATIKNVITLDNIAQIFAKIPQYLISFLVYLIALFLFMLELPILKSKVYHLFTEETAKKVSFMNARLSNVLLGFLKAQFLLSIIIFIVSLIGLLFIAPEVAVIMALLIWLIDLIPIIGSIIILAPWASFMFLSGNSTMAIKLSILAIVLLAIRRIIEPKLMGQHIGLSPLATLIAMFLGLKLIGITGFVLGPLLVIAFSSAKEAGIIKWNVKI
ncbi:sporulation integral membrane protein YtvI [Virgibacillus sp. W0430]|uniref:sporulation integral membrane protein YtvI n=1 Tax=Virgibacillus sp. W0430 TaxID=3391580 RepID=UPI003F469D98